MFNADVLEESIKLTVLPSPVGLNLQDFPIKESVRHEIESDERY